MWRTHLLRAAAPRPASPPGARVMSPHSRQRRQHSFSLRMCPPALTDVSCAGVPWSNNAVQIRKPTFRACGSGKQWITDPRQYSWIPYECKYKTVSKAAGAKCVGKLKILFSGDSHMRTFYNAFMEQVVSPLLCHLDACTCICRLTRIGRRCARFRRRRRRGTRQASATHPTARRRAKGGGCAWSITTWGKHV